MNPDILRITHRGTNVKSKVLREPQRYLEALGVAWYDSCKILALTESFSYGMDFAKGGWYKTCKGALGISVRKD